MTKMAEILPERIMEYTEKTKALRIKNYDWVSILRKNTKSVSDLRTCINDLVTKIENEKDASNIFIVSKNNQNIAAVISLSDLEQMIKAQDILFGLTEQLEQYQEAALADEAFKRWNSETNRYSLGEVVTELKIDQDKLLQ